MVTMRRFQDAGQPAGRLASRRRRRGDAPHDRSGAPLQNTSIVRPPNATDEPYTVAPRQPVPVVAIAGPWRAHANHYGRISLRYSDYDFKNKSMKGVGFDWPIAYEDLAPYYDKGRTIHRRHRTAPEGLAQRARRHLPDAGAVEAARTSHLRACEKLGIKATSSRQAVITSPLNGRPACIYCGNCGRGYLLDRTTHPATSRFSRRWRPDA